MRPLFLLLALAAGGCAESALVPTAGAGPESLEQARERWEASGAEAYTMTLTRSCFCPEEYRGPFAVAVSDGDVTSVTLNGSALPNDRALTVEALFDLLAEAYEQDAARVDVTYDANSATRPPSTSTATSRSRTRRWATPWRTSSVPTADPDRVRPLAPEAARASAA